MAIPQHCSSSTCFPVWPPSAGMEAASCADSFNLCLFVGGKALPECVSWDWWGLDVRGHEGCRRRYLTLKATFCQVSLPRTVHVATPHRLVPWVSAPHHGETHAAQVKLKLHSRVQGPSRTVHSLLRQQLCKPELHG